MLLNTLKELEQTNASLKNISFFNSRLIGILGHDMIIPLHYIKKVTEQIKMHKDKLSANTINESIEDVNYTSKLLLYQSESLLQWAKFHDTNFKPVKSIINLNKIINELAELHTPLLNEKNNTIQLNLLEDDTVYCDQVIIKIILHNLLLNANKFTNNGTITISVLACQPNLILKIKDTGVGIEKDTLLELKNLKFVNSKIGTNNEIGYGMGYSVIFYLLNSANAKIDFEIVRNEYTEITIEI
jgi:K+-sensing histidine kinase KdpD